MEHHGNRLSVGKDTEDLSLVPRHEGDDDLGQTPLPSWREDFRRVRRGEWQARRRIQVGNVPRQHCCSSAWFLACTLRRTQRVGFARD